MSTNALKRIINKDIKEISNTNLNSTGIYIQFDEDNMFKAKALIVGPKDTLYENGFLFFNITFPKNYPFSPPDISYVSRNKVRIHPNIYVSHHSSGFGKVCLSILGTWNGPKWTSAMDITTVLLTIQSLLDNNPLHHEPGQEKNQTNQNDLYNQVIKYETINTLLIRNYIDIPEGFEIFYNDMKNIVDKNKESMFEKVCALEKECKTPIIINIPIYRIHLKINYKELKEKYRSLIYQ